MPISMIVTSPWPSYHLKTSFNLTFKLCDVKSFILTCNMYLNETCLLTDTSELDKKNLGESIMN